MKEAFAVIAVAAGLSACGGGGEASPPPSTPTTKASSDGAVPANAAPVALSTGGAWPFLGAPSDQEKNEQLERLKKDPGPLKSNWTPPGKQERYGHAEGLVAAPLEAVRAKLTDYPHFKELAGPKFKTVRVVDKQGDKTDVYFQLPIMRGAIVINYVTRFAPPKPGAGGSVIEGTFVKGNIKDMHIAFSVRPGADDKSTVVVCDLLLQPPVPAPRSAIDEELRDACGDAIVALRNP